MKITVTSVYDNPSLPIGYTKVPGYWVDFVSDCLTGQAILIPYDGLIHPSVGQEFFVEPECERVSHIRILAPDDQRPLGIHHIPGTTTYEAIATVQHIEWLVDPVNNFAITMSADIIGFTFDAKDIGDITLAQHDKVVITIDILLLWDEHL